MIEKILETAFSGFWPFVGVSILLNATAYFCVNLALRMWKVFLFMLMVMVRGWPTKELMDAALVIFKSTVHTKDE